MDIIEVIVLALIQGITEFLPISSSAHLILPSQLFGWSDQGLAFDVAVHVGSLVAVITYFRHDVTSLTKAWFQSLNTQPNSEKSQEAWILFYATIPAVVIGLMINGYADMLRSTVIIAIATIFFALLLAYADKVSNGNNIHQLTVQQGLIIGVMQCLAFIPGTSRSGITMTAGLLLGLSKEASARFSFLLSIPIIAGAGCLKCFDLLQLAEPVDWFSIVLGSIVSGASAYLCIRLFIEHIQKMGFMPFVIYRLFLGVFLLIFFT